MKQILLSADGDVSLYQVTDEILQSFDNLIKEFYKQLKSSFFTEKDFVIFLQEKYQKDAIVFIKNLGEVDEKTLSTKYQNILYYNF